MKVYNGPSASGPVWIDLDEETLSFCFNNFLTIADYNGYENSFKEVYKEFRKAPFSCPAVSRPKSWNVNNVDNVDGVFWSWLVLTFGDYGTSPRFGWVYEENAGIVLDLFQKYYERFE